MAARDDGMVVSWKMAYSARMALRCLPRCQRIAWMLLLLCMCTVYGHVYFSRSSFFRTAQVSCRVGVNELVS